MPTKNMTKNIKLRSGFRRIPDFNNYAINRDGNIYNIATNTDIAVHDYDHWSGRVTLYNTTTKGKRTKKKMNICSLLMNTFGYKTDKSIRSRLLVES